MTLYRPLQISILKLLLLSHVISGIIGSSLRFVGGSESSGRVEIMYDGVWGTICDDGWDLEDAHVVCRMHGFRRATAAPPNATYGKRTGKIWLTNVSCTGHEATIWECNKSAWGKHQCGHEEDASVNCVWLICKGEISSYLVRIGLK